MAKHRWQGSGLPVMDPTRTAQAAKMALEMGLTTMEDEAIEYNGSSAKANRAKLRQEFSELPQAPWSNKQESVTVTGGAARASEETDTENEETADD